MREIITSISKRKEIISFGSYWDGTFINLVITNETSNRIEIVDIIPTDELSRETMNKIDKNCLNRKLTISPNHSKTIKVGFYSRILSDEFDSLGANFELKYVSISRNTEKEKYVKD